MTNIVKNFQSRCLAISFLAFFSLAARAAHSQITIELNRGNALPGDKFTIAAAISNGAASVSLQFDLAFDPSHLTAGAVNGGSALRDHIVDVSVTSPGTLRILIYSPTNSPLGDGTLVTLPFTIRSDAAPGDTFLTVSALLLSDAQAHAVLPGEVINGNIHILGPPASITILDGDHQSTVINSGFPQLLQVLVKDAAGNPVSGAAVVFTPPGSGAGAALNPNGITTTDAQGIAEVMAIANGIGGSYQVTANVQGATFSSVAFNLTNLDITAVPTLGIWGLLALGVALFWLGLRRLRNGPRRLSRQR